MDDAPSSFMGIPSEIRVLIYQFLFNLDLWRIPRLGRCYNDAAGCCDFNLLDGRIYTRRRWSPVAFKNFTAILRTCRLVNREAIGVLYEQTLFNVRISDEQYNRTMRSYAPLNECAFLPRVDHIRINHDVRTYQMLLKVPELLHDLLNHLTTASSKALVEIAVTPGALTDFLPTVWPPEDSIEDPNWEILLLELQRLRSQVTFRMQTYRVRNSVQARLDQLIQATEG